MKGYELAGQAVVFLKHAVAAVSVAVFRASAVTGTGQVPEQVAVGAHSSSRGVASVTVPPLPAVGP